MSVLVPAQEGNAVLSAPGRAEDILDKLHIQWHAHDTKTAKRICVSPQMAKKWDIDVLFFVSVPFYLEAPLPYSVAEKLYEQFTKHNKEIRL